MTVTFRNVQYKDFKEAYQVLDSYEQYYNDPKRINKDKVYFNKYRYSAHETRNRNIIITKLK